MLKKCTVLFLVFIFILTSVNFTFVSHNVKAATLLSSPPESFMAPSNLRAHPRLHVTSAADFQTLKTRIDSDSTLAGYYLRLKADADRILTLPKYTYTTACADGLESAKQTAIRMNTVLLVWRIEKAYGNETTHPSDKYKNYGMDMLVETTNGYGMAYWTNWKVDGNNWLAVAELTHAAAIGYDWLHMATNFTTAQKTDAANAIKNKGIIPTQTQIRSASPDWMNGGANIALVVASNVALGALAIGDESAHAVAADDFIDQDMITAMNTVWAEFQPDGGWREGPMYWSYGTRSIAYLLSSFKTAILSSSYPENDIGIGSLDGFKDTSNFGMSLAGGAKYSSFNFGDANLSSQDLMYVSGHASSFYAKKYNRPEYMWHHRDYLNAGTAPNYHYSVSPFDILWYDNAFVSNADLQAFPKDLYFGGTEVATMRNSWVKADGTYDDTATIVGIKGHNTVDRHHTMLDHGEFFLDALGIRWAENLGNDNYGLQDYFDDDSGRWKYYVTRPEGQNTMVINHDLNPGTVPYNAGQNINANSKIVQFDTQTNEAFSILDMTAAYGTQYKVVNAERGLKLYTDGTFNRKKIILQDEVTTDRASGGNLYWFMHYKSRTSSGGADGSNISYTIDDANRRITLTHSTGKKLVMTIITPTGSQGVFRVMDCNYLPTSPTPPPGSGTEDSRASYKKVYVNLTNLTQNVEKKLSILIEPLASAESPTPLASLPAIVDLDDWQVNLPVDDTFTGKVDNGWFTKFGNWAYDADGTNNALKVESTETAKAYKGSAKWTNYRVLSSIKVPTGSTWKNVYLVARYKDESNYYYAGYDYSSGGRLVINKVLNGVTTTIGTYAMAAPPLNTYKNFKFTVSGSNLSLYYDDISTAKITVPDSSHTAGKAGLYTSGNPALFNSVNIATVP